MLDIYEYIAALHRRRGRPSSGIIYCRAKVTCDELSAYLRGKGINAKPYHRGIAYAFCLSDSGDAVLCTECQIFVPFVRAMTLDKTLKEWEIGGSGEGVDVVC